MWERDDVKQQSTEMSLLEKRVKFPFGAGNQEFVVTLLCLKG